MTNGPISVAQLGFGCAGLMGRLGLRASVNLLAAANDAGITYFDVARSYGYGAAERAVGIFAKGKRHRIVIATKFGIMPPRRSVAMDVAKKAASVIIKLHPGLRQQLRARAGTMVGRAMFGIDVAQTSFATSLRELQTDHVDVLLLHQCEPEHLQDAPLRELLGRWCAQGVVGRCGIAAEQPTIAWALRERPFERPVYQFANSMLEPFHVPQLRNETVVTHSALRDHLPQVLARLAADTNFARRWSQLDVGTDKDTVAAILLAWALRQFPDGKVLFSSSRADAIVGNVHRALTFAAEPDRLQALATIMGSVRRDVA